MSWSYNKVVDISPENGMNLSLDESVVELCESQNPGCTRQVLAAWGLALEIAFELLYQSVDDGIPVGNRFTISIVGHYGSNPPFISCSAFPVME